MMVDHVLYRILAVALVSALSGPGLAQTPPAPGNTGSGDTEIVPYEAAFFNQYSPVTAQDMVEQVPGYSFQAGGGRRGFGGAAGNLLIDGERPSTKSNDAGEILQRISASQVERIELIRGDTSAYDVGNQSIVANVILSDGAATSVRWEAGLEQPIESSTIKPQGSVAVRGRAGNTQYVLGLEAQDFKRVTDGFEALVTGGSLAEERFEFEDRGGQRYTGNVNATTRFGDTLTSFNALLEYEEFSGTETSRRVPVLPEAMTETVIEGDSDDALSLEVGGDAEFAMTPDFSLKPIFLFNYEDGSGESTERILEETEDTRIFTRADRESEETETVARLEMDWRRFDQHRLDANVEVAFNTLESALLLTEDQGEGPVEIPLPGANTRVEEERAEIELTDAWSMGDWVVNSTLAAEYSKITQSGDVNNEQEFDFIKPGVTVTYSPVRDRQYRFRFDRRVRQLNFNNFVSATNFGDDEADLGNPDLSPQNTWISEVSFEQRFGEIGTVTVTGFHNWVKDVQDQLPVGDGFEVPGNIGDGRRWGVRLESTLPLDALGIDGGRLDLESRWRDSTVPDPVTGDDRRFSDADDFNAELEFRQDIQRWNFTWGWSLDYRAEETSYGLDELVTTDLEGTELDFFMEYSGWRGVKIRFDASNLTDNTFHRDRRVFEGSRGLSPEAFREVRDQTEGPEFGVTFSGSF